MNKYKIMKSLLLLGIFALIFTDCKKEEDEGDELKINFKTEAGYTASDATLPKGSQVKIGVEAETEKATDPIIKFNISESVNNGANATVYSEDLSNTDYEYDYEFSLDDSVPGNTHTYTFTITNRDGINAQKNLTVTVE